GILTRIPIIYLHCTGELDSLPSSAIARDGSINSDGSGSAGTDDIHRAVVFPPQRTNSSHRAKYHARTNRGCAMSPASPVPCAPDPSMLIAESAQQFGLHGQSQAHRQLLDRIVKVAGVDAEVLVTGPTGVGKELYARYLHESSPRRARTFVPINCGA